MSINVNRVPSSAGGGLSTFHLVSLATTNATLVASGPKQLYGWAVFNTGSIYCFLCFHDINVLPTAGSNVFFKYGVPTQGGTNQTFTFGIQFNSGLAITTVANPIDSDANAITAQQLTINLFYK